MGGKKKYIEMFD